MIDDVRVEDKNKDGYGREEENKKSVGDCGENKGATRHGLAMVAAIGADDTLARA